MTLEPRSEYLIHKINVHNEIDVCFGWVHGLDSMTVVFKTSTGCETPEFIVPNTSLQLHGIVVLQNPWTSYDDPNIRLAPPTGTHQEVQQHKFKNVKPHMTKRKMGLDISACLRKY